ncbi:MAG: hypothetical protein B7Z73_10175, partial [Planctomycetia bacterium 21-64-5]
ATQSETIELAMSYGFRGIDVDIVEFAEEVTSYGLPKARRLLDSAKLKIGTFALPIEWQADDATFHGELTKLSDLAGLAASIGARRAVGVIAPASNERPYHENFEFYGRRLSDLGRALEPHGLKLGVGFDAVPALREGKHFEFVHTLDALLVLLSTVSAPNVGLWLDIWHVWLSGASLAEVRQQLTRTQLVAVSLSDAAPADASDRDSADSRWLPGETGVIDATAILTALAELGYDGPVTPLPGRHRLAGMRRDQIVKLAGEKLDGVWKAAGLSPSGKISASAGR